MTAPPQPQPPPSPPAAPPSRRLAPLSRLGSRVLGVQEIGILFALLALCTYLALVTDGFLTRNNLLEVARQASGYGIMAVGMVFLLAMGEIDLSVGSVFMLCNLVAAVAVQRG